MARPIQPGQRPDGPPGARPAHGAADSQASPALRPFEALALRAARSECTILLTGETGVGKGHVAKWIHANSPRRDRAFIPVNCGAIPESIIDSQLFGHVRGSFSGASADHPGLVRAAEQGTFFLDEVGELPASAQTRLLRLLQDREVQPVGRTRPVTVDVRVISATNRDPDEAVAAGRFREDLLFRLDVVRIHLPALRERREEIPALLDGFNREFAELYGQSPLVLTDDATDRLLAHPWPGNIRQLRSVVERLHVLCPEEPIDSVRLEEVGQLRGDRATPATSTLGTTLSQVRASELRRVLDEHDGSISRTAAVFGVHRSTIYRWLRDAAPVTR